MCAVYLLHLGHCSVEDAGIFWAVAAEWRWQDGGDAAMHDAATFVFGWCYVAWSVLSALYFWRAFLGVYYFGGFRNCSCWLASALE